MGVDLQWQYVEKLANIVKYIHIFILVSEASLI